MSPSEVAAVRASVGRALWAEWIEAALPYICSARLRERGQALLDEDLLAQLGVGDASLPVAVLRFEHGAPGRENDMPRVVSCNWQPDGDYPVYLAAPGAAIGPDLGPRGLEVS